MSWSWHTAPLTYKDKCCLCRGQLQQEEVVKWTNGELYHVGCLLNYLASFWDQQQRASPAGGTDCGSIAGGWGAILGGHSP